MNDAATDGGTAARYRCTDLPRLPSRSQLRLAPAFESELQGLGGAALVQLEQSPRGATRWYVVTKGGVLYTFREGEAATVALDLSDRLWLEHPDAGFVSLAFAPDFVDSGLLYVVYYLPGGPLEFIARVARFHSEDAGLTFDLESEEVILDVPQPDGAHNVNHVRFGPDGLLYISLGDGSYAANARAQDPNTLYGSILRVDVSADDDERGTPYRIPSDNPFADGGGAPEVYAFGLRNPWRFSFDRQTGELWAGDVGLNAREEIDRIVPGANYGWPFLEGTLCWDESECHREDLTPPFFEYSHAQTGSGGGTVTAGYVYRGDSLAGLRGSLVFADFLSGKLWALDVQQESAPSTSLLLESSLRLVSFAEDAQGELYAVGYSENGMGGLYRLEPRETVEGETAVGEFWLSETGCVDADDPAQPIPSAVRYEVRAPLWSDGADKTRAVLLPAGRALGLEADGDFAPPTGSVFIKTFAFDGRLHETRLLVHHESGWAGYSFEWNESGSDARLLPSGKTVTLPGGATWTFPSRGDCFRCHTDAAGVVLGAEWPQLAGELQPWFDAGYFGPEAASPADLELGGIPALQTPFGSGALAARARSYLHANCSGCHRPGVEGQRASIDLRFGTALADAQICDVVPLLGDLRGAVPDARIVAPGAPESSVLYRRMTTLQRYRMPALGSHRVDDAGTGLIAEWIESLEGCPDSE